MCGEHTGGVAVGACVQGSSPHVRGAPGVQAEPSHTAGIIPACAGSTNRLHVQVVRRVDHPRMCGEHAALHQSAE